MTKLSTENLIGLIATICVACVSLFMVGLTLVSTSSPGDSERKIGYTMVATAISSLISSAAVLWWYLL